MSEIRNLSMTTREVLLYEANIDLEKCTVYGLSARNGSGKTTLLRTISGLRKEPEGSILIQEGSKTLTLLESKQKLFYYETVRWFDTNLSGFDYLNFIQSAWSNEWHTSISEVISFWDIDNYIVITYHILTLKKMHYIHILDAIML